MQAKQTRIADYTYKLPDKRIAKYPLAQRDQSKLLVYKDDFIEDHSFITIAEQLPENASLVFNDSKVIPVRMYFETEKGKRIEIFCQESIKEEKQGAEWKCMVGGAAKWKEEYLRLIKDKVQLQVKILDRRDGQFNIQFQWNDESLAMSDILELFGNIPIPPYLNRSTEAIDKIRYQNVFAQHDGSVAAPTAGLHFTKDILVELEEKKIEIDFVTLHVGAGTFKPVKTETLGEHTMHREQISVHKNFLLKLKERHSTHSIVAVGTTSLRSLESIYWAGCQLSSHTQAQDLVVNQWTPYENNINLSVEMSIDNILNFINLNDLECFTFYTELLVLPSYSFRLIDCLITNFHQPNSTLLLLIASAIGPDWQKVYDHALQNNYRFLSYGDSSLLYLNRTRT